MEVAGKKSDCTGVTPLLQLLLFLACARNSRENISRLYSTIYPLTRNATEFPPCCSLPLRLEVIVVAVGSWTLSLFFPAFPLY